jgi:hypothetical protein
MILYRPMGIEELRLVYESGMTSFPPRKPDQPIFYPVLNLEYAREISRRWNVDSPSAAGYVAKFFLDDDYGKRYPVQKVGTAHHLELWIPSEQLAEFNQKIFPPILIVDAFFGDAFQGCIPNRFGLRGKNAAEQLGILSATMTYSKMDFNCEIAVNHLAVFLNYAFWTKADFSNRGITPELKLQALHAVRQIWSQKFPNTPLPNFQN